MAETQKLPLGYTEKSIRVLVGVESIRQTPAMYITNTGTEGVLCLLTEIIDNAVDEHLAGHASSITVAVDTKKRIFGVKDDGRGVPVGVHEQTGEPTIIAVFSRMFTGGKYGRHAYSLCFTGDTEVRLLDGTIRSMRWLAKHKQGQTFWVLSCKPAGATVFALASNPHVSGMESELIEVTLGNGTTERCTHGHPWMLRDGTYKNAEDLATGDLLMPAGLGPLSSRGKHRVRFATPITLPEPVEVFDIQVPRYHNFALASGVFVHNSGGLHGIGSKATCALSDMMEVTTIREGKRYRVRFCRGEVSEDGLQTLGRSSSKGTSIRFRPDKQIFGKAILDVDALMARLEAIAYLCPELTVRASINGKKKNLSKRHGLAGFLKAMTKKSKGSLFDKPARFSVRGSFEEQSGRIVFVESEDGTEGLDAALTWTTMAGEGWHSFVNMIPVPDHGTHVSGAKQAITRVLTKLCKNKRVTGDDFREGLQVAMHVRLRKPQFEGQTKNKLNNPEVRGMAQKMFSRFLTAYLRKHRDLVATIMIRAEAVAKARLAFKAARSMASQTAYSSTEGRGALPAKLLAAPRCRPHERELFIVEGGSAGGPAATGRNGYYQEVLPLKGKPKNAIKPTGIPQIAALFKNDEIDAIVRAIGAGHDVEHAGESCDPSKARVNKVVIMCFALETPVLLADGRGTIKTIRELIDEYGTNKPFPVFARTPQGGTVVAMAYNARVTGTVTEMAEVEFEDGSVTRCTPDHLWMVNEPVQNDSRVEWHHGLPYIQAQDLTENDDIAEGSTSPTPQLVEIWLPQPTAPIS